MYVLKLLAQNRHVLLSFSKRGGSVFRIQSECISKIIIIMRPLTARINQLESK